MRFSRFSCFFVLVLGSLTLLGGCSGNKKNGEVTGTVNLDGKPLPYGILKFSNPTGKATDQSLTGEINDGEFSIKKVPVGELKVSIKTELTAMPEEFRIKVESLKNTKKIAADAAAKAGQPADTTIVDEQIAEAQKELDKATALQKKLKVVPKKYWDEKTSGITVTIKGGAQTLDPIELSSK